jgi:DNA ligase (NAD+)
MAVVGKLLDMGIDPKAADDDGASSSKLKGLSFCVTGALSRPRAEIHGMIKKAGGDVHTAVKKGTSYLVAGEKAGAKKIENAKKNETFVIDEAQFKKLIEEGEA